MFIPGLTPRSPKKGVYPRRGGGGGGKGGGGGGSSSKGGSGSSGGSSSGSAGKQGTVPVSGATGGRSSAVAYGGGGGKAITLPAGQPFAGRTAGGATRAQVYGSACVYSYSLSSHVIILSCSLAGCTEADILAQTASGSTAEVSRSSSGL